jgi:hypothetical protein
MTTLDEGIASIMRTRCYEPPPLPRRIPLHVRFIRFIRTIARQLSPTGWALVFSVLAVGSTLGFLL